MSFQEALKILGLKEGFSISELESKYKSLARQYHPDLNNSSSAVEKMQEINNAREFLASYLKKQNNAQNVNKDNNQNNHRKSYNRQAHEFSMLEKRSILNDALKSTYIKYGINQAITALENLITEGNYGYFTNGSGSIPFRHVLRENVSVEEVKEIIFSALTQTYSKYSDYIKENTDSPIWAGVYCKEFFKNELALMFDEICSVTALNYGVEHLTTAITDFITNGHVQRFSRYYCNDTEEKINYRLLLININRYDVINFMKSSLAMRGIDTQNISENDMIDSYSKCIYDSLYANIDQSAHISK